MIRKQSVATSVLEKMMGEANDLLEDYHYPYPESDKPTPASVVFRSAVDLYYSSTVIFGENPDANHSVKSHIKAYVELTGRPYNQAKREVSEAAMQFEVALTEAVFMSTQGSDKEYLQAIQDLVRVSGFDAKEVIELIETERANFNKTYVPSDE